jgi:hypothetical protein
MKSQALAFGASAGFSQHTEYQARAQAIGIRRALN